MTTDPTDVAEETEDSNTVLFPIFNFCLSSPNRLDSPAATTMVQTLEILFSADEAFFGVI